MRCLMRRSMLVCATLSLSSCAHQPLAIDGYCERYNKVIQEKGDGNIIAKPGPKRRILANELTYRDQCVPKK
jgi:hypothetical protein